MALAVWCVAAAIVAAAAGAADVAAAASIASVVTLWSRHHQYSACFVEHRKVALVGHLHMSGFSYIANN